MIENTHASAQAQAAARSAETLDETIARLAASVHAHPVALYAPLLAALAHRQAAQAGRGEPPSAYDVQALRAMVQRLDAVAQELLSQVRGIARLCHARVAGVRGLGDVEQGLLAIVRIASQAEGFINDEAEGVGCNHVNEAERRRWQAYAGDAPGE